MCDGIEIEGKKIIFGEGRDLLPITHADEEVNWVIWGERREGDCYPHGGWVHPGDLKSSSWRPWRPKEVVIPADRFMVRNDRGKAEWFPLEPGMGIRGMMACRELECRLYIVTTTPPEQYGWARRWPDVVTTLPNQVSAIESKRPSQYEHPDLLHA
ncbi:MAG: hypothetical protein ACAH06_07435 [Methylophilaceae bacterium]|jgi:hypothetical protein|uniref:hypothetical protein n=1 Tax=Methylobacillus sp. MM3 TaxID=1848039 RepID=UPI001041BE60|nr:hypothetical protein [Methylobacillus sp. MM3]